MRDAFQDPTVVVVARKEKCIFSPHHHGEGEGWGGGGVSEAQSRRTDRRVLGPVGLGHGTTAGSVAAPGKSQVQLHLH